MGAEQTLPTPRIHKVTSNIGRVGGCWQPRWKIRQSPRAIKTEGTGVCFLAVITADDRVKPFERGEEPLLSLEVATPLNKSIQSTLTSTHRNVRLACGP